MKGLKHFYKSRTSADGYMSICKECHCDAVHENRKLKQWALTK